MAKDNYSPFNQIPKKCWKRFKFFENLFVKYDNEVCQIAIEGHITELKNIFNIIIDSDSSTDYQKKLTKNIWERYDLTNEISSRDLFLIQGWYSGIVSSQVSAAINKNLNSEETLDNLIP